MDSRTSFRWVDAWGGDGDDYIHIWTTFHGASHGGAGDDTVWRNNLGTSVITGGPGNDHLQSYATRHDMAGGDGDDLLVTVGGGGNELDGGQGNDQFVVPSFGGGTMNGGPGADTFVLARGTGIGGTLNGGRGADTIQASPFYDSVLAGDGDDVVDVSGDAADTADTVSCGLGHDSVYADPGDVVSDDCEHRYNGPMPPNAAVAAATAHARETFPDYFLR